MRVFTWFWLSCKRQLKHPFFMITLLLVPMCLFAFSQVEKQDSGKIRIGIFGEDREFVPEVLEVLAAQEGMFEFYICQSEEMLKDDVASRKAECGYVFRKGFYEKLDEQDFKRSILVYSAPSTIAARLSQEVVFASMFDVYGEYLLDRFVNESGIFEGMDLNQVLAEMKAAYQQEMDSGSTFSFRYETLSTEPVESTSARIAFPVRGMLAIYLMMIGLFSVVALRQDEARGLFVTLSETARIPCKLASVTAPVVMAGISALVTLLVTANFDYGIMEVPRLLIYIAMIVAVSYVMKLLVKDPVVLCGLIPIFILCSMVICPVFFDITLWLPQLEPVRYLCLPYYYIK